MREFLTKIKFRFFELKYLSILVKFSKKRATQEKCVWAVDVFANYNCKLQKYEYTHKTQMKCYLNSVLTGKIYLKRYFPYKQLVARRNMQGNV